MAVDELLIPTDDALLLDTDARSLLATLLTTLAALLDKLAALLAKAEDSDEDMTEETAEDTWLDDALLFDELLSLPPQATNVKDTAATVASCGIC